MLEFTPNTGRFTARCLLLSLFLIAFSAFSTNAFAQEKVHGVAFAKSCTNIPRTCDLATEATDCPGDANECTESFCDTTIPRNVRCIIEVRYNDDFKDTVNIEDVTDVIYADLGNVSSTPRISFATGVTTCVEGPFVPCTIGPEIARPFITQIQFIVDTYEPTSDDPSPLLDDATLDYLDQCDGDQLPLPDGQCVQDKPDVTVNGATNLVSGCDVRNKANSTICTDTGQECWDAGCFAATPEDTATCIQQHVPVSPSTPCTEASGTECTDAGCDGAGTCDPLHINKTDSTPCTDTGQECWNAGCEAGVCEQQHVPETPSTPCTEASGTECTDAGCDGAGLCDPLHINKTDSTPCTDTGQECWNAGCEAGVCEQQHVPETPSTPCTEADGTECTDAGCDGAGLCDPLHINKTDSTPCTDTGQECWNAGCEAGVCEQQHVPETPSTPCTEADGTECTDAGCDGAGLCDPLHINKTDSTPCTDTGQECWNAGCEAGVCEQQHVPETPSTPCTEASGTECTDAGCDGAGLCDPLHINKSDSTPCGDTGDECFDAGCESGLCVQTHVPLVCGDEICRTPGFWGSRGGIEKAPKSQNITQSVICDGDIDCIIDPVANPPANPLDVCGTQISDTALLSDGSAIEAICVNVKGDSKRQLVRQLTAAALNCRMATCTTEHATLLANCNATCANEVVGEYTDCIGDLDYFNNGGGGEGVCEIGGEYCDDGTPCAGLGDSCLPAANCHDEELPCDDVVCYEPPGPASSPRKCNAARKNTFFVAPSTP